MHRITQSAISKWREETAAAQGGRCALCGDPFEMNNPPVADHDHSTGHLRAVLHRGCNAALGHIENNRPRYLLKGARLGRMLRAAFEYIHADYTDKPLHHTHKTPLEKKERVNAKARKRRAVAKAAIGQTVPRGEQS